MTERVARCEVNGHGGCEFDCVFTAEDGSCAYLGSVIDEVTYEDMLTAFADEPDVLVEQ